MWEVSLNRKLICGAGKLREAGKIAREMGRKALIVTYLSGMKKTGIVDRLEKILEGENVDYYTYRGIAPDPDIASIDKGAGYLLENGCDMVIGIGGGSALDAAKAIAMLVTNGGSIREYQMGQKTVSKPTAPVIAIPTTSGTGSESTKISVVTNIEEGIKKSVTHPFMVPDTAILDAELTVPLPARLTAATGMDALGHAIESYVSLNANPITEAYGLKAIELIAANLEEAVNNGSNLTARENMAVASSMAGTALNAGVGLAHIVGQPFGAVYHISHGDAISIMLPVTIELNLAYSTKKYASIARAMGVDCTGLSESKAAEKAVLAVKELRDRTGAQKSLKSLCGADTSSFGQVFDSISRSTSHIKCNPRPVDEDLFREALNMAL